MNKIDNPKQYEEAIKIRYTEESFLSLFKEGKINGTVHTCIGQEFSALAFAGQISKDDAVFSNHRCHGHFLSYTKNYAGLISELLGKETGVCGGVGSSQHLHQDNFYSNGIQGGIMPLAAGFALGFKLQNKKNIAVCYIGDGTLGEGVVYETFNMISKWKIPLLVVCENNGIAQSTLIDDAVSGSISKRAEAFDIKVFEGNTINNLHLFEESEKAINFVRKNSEPAFFNLTTKRLKAHSKGDDTRPPHEIKEYENNDPINVFKKTYPQKYNDIYKKVKNEIDNIIFKSLKDKELDYSKYFKEDYFKKNLEWKKLEHKDGRIASLINNFFHKELEKEKTVFIGEDILSPYGGAFKISENLSTKFPDKVFSSPISEAGIVGLANGLSLNGFKPYVEIMFGDFITLCMDQLINHASKFKHMYNHQVNSNIVIRTPMGGHRGYGPTHSQSLEKFLVGIDEFNIIATNKLINPSILYEEVSKRSDPTIVIENKLDYAKQLQRDAVSFYDYKVNNFIFPSVKISPKKFNPLITLVTYGGSVDLCEKVLNQIFSDEEIFIEVIILSSLRPIDYDAIIESLAVTQKLITVEESSRFSGIGSEIVASLNEKMKNSFSSIRIASDDIPIPSSKTLETASLVNSNKIIRGIMDLL